MFPNTTKILICDDMLTMRKILKKCLGEIGLTNVVEAKDGAMGFEEFNKALTEKAPFGLVLSDWNMPNLMGIELLKKVRAHPEASKTPFVLVTADS